MDKVYVDYAGCVPINDDLVSFIHSNMTGLKLGNPHSHRNTAEMVDSVRSKILSHFGVSEADYCVIFTSGCTGALKLLAEYFDFGTHGPCACGSPELVYTQDSHTSVVGMRQYASARQAKWRCLNDIDLETIFDQQNDNNIAYGTSTTQCTTDGLHTNSLFVYPLQSNFCGRKYPKSWTRKVKAGNLKRQTVGTGTCTCNWFVCVDAAAYVCNSRLDLSGFQPDFVTLSFYKIFGYPTGLGCLIVKKSSGYVLKKSYFGGGTVQVALPSKDFQSFRPSLDERFEDGTISYYSIVSLLYCFEYFHQNNLFSCGKKTFELTALLYKGLKSMKHHNGTDICTVYTRSDFTDSNIQGPILTFNLRNDDGSFIGYSQVEKMAELYNIQLRTGCMCNQGACQIYLGLSNEEIVQNFQSGKVCGDKYDLLNGRPLGCVRVSLGCWSTKDDIAAVLAMVYDCFCVRPQISWLNLMDKLGLNQSVDDHIITNGNMTMLNTTRLLPKTIASDNSCKGTLTNLLVYPVKSCRSFAVYSWPLAITGLLYDRNWMIVNKEGVCMSQKRCPLLTSVIPTIDVQQSVLTLQSAAAHQAPVFLPLQNQPHTGTDSVKVCMNRVSTTDCGGAVSQWLTNVISLSGCKLVRQTVHDTTQLSLVNEAQLLLVNRASIHRILTMVHQVEPNLTEFDLISRFRPNLVMDALQPFVEDGWTGVTIGDVQFEVVGKCHRCQMICIDQNSGLKNPEIMKSLRNVRREQEMTFGIYLRQRKSQSIGLKLKIGDLVTVQ